MSDLLGNWRRTLYAGELRQEHIGSEVTLMGWVQKRRNLGGLYFVDLRDREGLAQIVFDDDVSAEAFAKAAELTNESVIAVKGEVRQRESVNQQMPTGQVEVFAKELKILSLAELAPIHINDDDGASELLKLQYRYLDLRKPKMQKYIRTRHQISRIMREFLNEEGFVDIETPILTKPTPEGARDYLVPSRVHPGKFYALPQSPQIFKQLLMVGGFDKYYQIARCFRDEDLRADRQPEFTQLDIEMSFVDQSSVMDMTERLFKRLFKEILGIEFKEDFIRMSYAEAMEKYGSDKPDMRFDIFLHDISSMVKGCGFGVFENAAVVKGISIKNGVEHYSKKALKNLEKTAKKYGAKGLAWMAFKADGLDSPIAKFLSDEFIENIKAEFAVETGDLLLFVADKKSVVNNALGGLRLEAANKLGLIKEDDYKVLWVENFPLFEYDEDDQRYYAKHHPFTSPMDEDLDIIESDPENARAKAYDIVINGYEAGGGSIRIHRPDLQERMFKALGLGKEEIEEKFGFLVEAFKYGTPPHGGIALGLDRLTMIFTGTDNIKDVIAFPKTQNATSPLTKAPSRADKAQLEELAIAVTAVEKE